MFFYNALQLSWQIEYLDYLSYLVCVDCSSGLFLKSSNWLGNELKGSIISVNHFNKVRTSAK